MKAILQDRRVTKAVFVGHDAGRPMIDFAMEGFVGTHTLGRVISALGEAARQTRAGAINDDKVQKKHDADRLELSKLVPADGKDRFFERNLEKTGQTGIDGDARTQAWIEVITPLTEGLTGSVKQRAWAGVLRLENTESNLAEDKRAKAYKKFKSAKFWIDNRSNVRLRLMIEAL